MATHRLHSRSRLALSLTLLLICIKATVGFGIPKGRDKSVCYRSRTSHQRRILPRVNSKIEPNGLARYFRQEQQRSLLALRSRSQEDVDATASPNGSRSLVTTVALTALTVTASAAKLGILPGPIQPDGSFGPYTDALIARDVGATLLTAVLGYGYVKIITTAAARGYLESRDSRKLIHTFSAPLFILFWPLYSQAAAARLFCFIVPFTNGIRLYTAAQGSSEEASLAAAVSRTGDSREAVGGPFIYVCIMAACILLQWRDPVTVVALSNLAAGDGLADLVGRRWGGTSKWPGLDKSVAGTAAFWLGATICSIGLLLWLQFTNCLVLPIAGQELIFTIAGISLVAALFELLPWADDNYTVPLSAAVLTMLLLR